MLWAEKMRTGTHRLPQPPKYHVLPSRSYSATETKKKKRLNKIARKDRAVHQLPHYLWIAPSLAWFPLSCMASLQKRLHDA
jgi:hypothetical protein